MRKLHIGLVAAGVILASIQSQAQTSFTVDPSASWLGFMNVSDLGQHYQFGSGWGTSDLVATFSGPVLTLAPNTIGDPNPYWYIGGGAPGATGNKIMDASMYVETTGTLNGQNVTFAGNVISATLAAVNPYNGVPWTSVAFIKDFAPDYSSFNTITAPVTSTGIFSISLNAVNDPARHVQYGFETIGSDVWATDPLLASFGNIQIAPVPEPSTIALMGLGSLALVALRRKNSK
jgi:hypothetical protein